MGAGVLGIASGIVGEAVKATTQNSRERRAMANQERLMEIQTKNQERLNKQGQELQMKTWTETNYPAQMRMLEEAGLNPALIYGTGGEGGKTGSQTGGSAQGGSAPSPQQLDIGNILQSAMIASQIEVAKSQAEKNKAEAASIRGEEGTKGQAEIALKGSQKNVEDVKYDKIVEEVNMIAIDRNIAQHTREAKIKQITNEAVSSEIKIQEQKAGIKLTDQQRERLWHQIRQEWIKAGLQGLDIIIKGRLKDIGKGNNINTSPLSEAAKKALRR